MTTPDPDAEHVPDLGPAPRRLSVDAATVRDLVADQFPQWVSQPVTPVATPGWDNLTFHLGDDLLVRMPSAAEYERAVEKEHRWLPVLASRLPFPVPTPLALGRPGPGYPFHWSVYDWLPGAPVDVAAIEDPAGLAADVTDFLAALRVVDPSDGPRPGVHNWFRGATLRTFDGWVRRDLLEPVLATDLDADAAAATWSRGRGWALWKALHTWVGAVEDGDEVTSTEARRVVTTVVAEHSG